MLAEVDLLPAYQGRRDLAREFRPGLLEREPRSGRQARTGNGGRFAAQDAAHTFGPSPFSVAIDTTFV